MRFTLFALAAVALAISLTPRAGAQAMVDKPLGKYFFFAGMNVRIDAIQTNPKKDGNPVLKNAIYAPDDKGYIVIKMTMQNPSASEDRGIPGNVFGFELQDGTQIDLVGEDAWYVGQSLADPPDSLHPKQTVQLTYVFSGWNGSPITKMFMKMNSGGGENDAGAKYARFQIPPNYVQSLTAVPTPQPTDGT